MKINENAIGYEDEEGMTIALRPEFAFMNVFRAEKFKTPIWQKKQVEVKK